MSPTLKMTMIMSPTCKIVAVSLAFSESLVVEFKALARKTWCNRFVVGFPPQIV